MIKILMLLFPLAALAQEPGYIINDAPIPPPQPPKVEQPPARTEAPKPVTHSAKARPTQPLLTEQFAKARGLQAYEIQTIHYNRISCDRRLYSASGHSVEGDADLKATNTPPDFIEVEFPSHINFESFGAENPYQNDVSDLETVTSRQLVSVRDWADGTSLKLTKHMRVRYIDDKKPAETVPVVTEVRVKDGTYPSTYLIRETVKIQPEFNLYYICQ